MTTITYQSHKGKYEPVMENAIAFGMNVTVIFIVYDHSFIHFNMWFTQQA
jgi:hypothetical protein